MVTALKIWWERLKSNAFGRWFFSRIVGFLIPYTGTINPIVKEIGPGFAQVLLKDKRRLRNHLSSVHALALANLGELTTGLALHFSLTASDRAILTKLQAQYFKKSRGTITAKARVPSQTLTGEVPVTAELFDENGTHVCTVTAHWLVSAK